MRADIIRAPIPTAPIGATFPSWPITAVSTTPNNGIVTLDKIIGIEIAKIRL